MAPPSCEHAAYVSTEALGDDPRDGYGRAALSDEAQMSSDIHKSDIDELRQRVAKRNYRRYLLEIRLAKLRALRDQKIRFDFPVTALIGTNGGGKSTVLGAAALAYKSIRPGEFFPKSNVGDLSMANWRVEYELIDRDLNQNPLTRNARFVSAKWRRDDLLNRDVVHFPIKRTVPAGEQTRYRRFIGIYEVKDPEILPLSEAVIKSAGRILGRDLTDYRVARLKTGDQEYILLGKRHDDAYSQFHFGAGEASIIDMVTRIEAASDFSLVLIEEIENGLHPLATETMVEYLISVAQRKKIQVIFTTHSEYALRRLPPDAKWAAIDGQLFQGDLNIESLRAITGPVEKSNVIFVEDEFAKDWIEDFIRQNSPSLLHSVEIHAAGGYPFVVDVTDHHLKNPSIKTKAIAIADGDAPVTQEERPQFLYVLPAGVPESVVWGFVASRAEEFAGLLQQRCQIPKISQDTIVKQIRNTQIETGDVHLLFKRLAVRLGFLSEIIVRRAFISVYNENNAAAMEDISQALASLKQ